MRNARRTEAEIEETLVALFAERPELCGFTIALDGALVAANVGLYPPPAADQAREICAEIRATLDEVMEASPAARQLLAGRTFARRLH
ncbi:MAG: hypothetical protein ACM30H_06370 [Clostridia bacterium]